MYVDGVRVNEPFSNTVMWDLIPSFSIDRMQMIGGSNPVFGLNTLGGALSMQTKSGQTFDKTAVDISAGSWGRKVSLIETGGISRDGKFDYYFGYEHFSEDGWRDFSPTHVNQLFGQVGWETDTSRYEVNYTGDGVRAILCRSTITQHFDVFQCNGWNGRYIGSLSTRTADGY